MTRLPRRLKLALASGWSIYAHHATSRDDDDGGLHYERWERPGHGEAKKHEYEARHREIPDDTRGLTAQILGDPLPGRSALDRRRHQS